MYRVAIFAHRVLLVHRCKPREPLVHLGNTGWQVQAKFREDDQVAEVETLSSVECVVFSVKCSVFSVECQAFMAEDEELTWLVMFAHRVSFLHRVLFAHKSGFSWFAGASQVSRR